MLRLALAGWAISMGSTQATVFATEPKAAPLPGSDGAIVSTAVTQSEPQTGRAAHADSARCPYDFGGDTPPATFCVYQGVALGSRGEVCGTDVVAIWSSASRQSPVSVGAAEESSASNREVYLGFVADPELVLLAIVDDVRGNRAELIGYAIGAEAASRPVGGAVTLQPVRPGAAADVLGIELRSPRHFRLANCAVARYSGSFLGVIRPPSDTEAYADTFIAPGQ